MRCDTYNYTLKLQNLVGQKKQWLACLALHVGQMFVLLWRYKEAFIF